MPRPPCRLRGSSWAQGLLKLMLVELVMPSNHLIFCLPLLLLFSVFPSISVQVDAFSCPRSFSVLNVISVEAKGSW